MNRWLNSAALISLAAAQLQVSAADAARTDTEALDEAEAGDGRTIVVSATRTPITIDEAVLGGKVEVLTIEGVAKLSIPKGASSGKVLRMRRRGVKSVGGGARGDQRVELKIVMPAVMNAELAEFFEEWRKGHAYDPRKGMMK